MFTKHILQLLDKESVPTFNCTEDFIHFLKERQTGLVENVNDFAAYRMRLELLDKIAILSRKVEGLSP